MKDNSIAKLGGTCAILVGISYIVVGGNYLLMPAEQRVGGDFVQLLVSLAQNSMPATIQWWAFALGAVLALAVVPAISESVRSVNEGWERWTSKLAFLGFAVLAINNLRLMSLLPERAAAYMAGDAATKVAIEMSGPFSLDPQAWLGFGAVGLWVLVVSLLALRGDIWPKPLVYVGIATTVAYWLVVAGFALSIEPLVAIAAGLGGLILAPIWYIWLGLRLRREN